MKRIIFLTLLLFFATVISAAAWISVPDRGDTGWRTYIYHAGPAGFTGTAGFVVSNVIDNSAYSELLLDNLSQGGGATNRGFESGNYSGYSLLGKSVRRGHHFGDRILAATFMTPPRGTTSPIRWVWGRASPPRRFTMPARRRGPPAPSWRQPSLCPPGAASLLIGPFWRET